jgi:hypothetical protein
VEEGQRARSTGVVDADRQLDEAVAAKLPLEVGRRVEPPSRLLDRDLPRARGADDDDRTGIRNGRQRVVTKERTAGEPPDQNVRVEEKFQRYSP